MAAKTKTMQQTQPTQAKEIKTDFIRAIMERRERAIREERALRYSAFIERKRIAKRKRRERIKEIIVYTILFTILGLAITCKWSGVIISNANENSLSSYTTESEFNRPQVTKVVCDVIEIKNDLVTVDYNGELYDFFQENKHDFFVGGKALCTFTENMELVYAEP